MRRRRWSRNVRLRYGGLGGWQEHQPAAERRRELRKVAKQDGPGEVSRRLNFLSNVANRVTNSGLEETAREDQRWVTANLEERRSRRSRPIRVRGSRRARGHRRARSRSGRRFSRTSGPRYL